MTQKARNVLMHLEISEDTPNTGDSTIRVGVHVLNGDAWYTVREICLPNDQEYSHVITVNSKHVIIIRDHASNWLHGAKSVTAVDT